jgi:hypothetical protein
MLTLYYHTSAIILVGAFLLGGIIGWFLKRWFHDQNVGQHEKDGIILKELKKLQKNFPFPFSSEVKGSVRLIVSEISLCSSDNQTKDSNSYVQKKIVTEVKLFGYNAENIRKGVKEVLTEHAISICNEAERYKDTGVHGTALHWLSGNNGRK